MQTFKVGDVLLPTRLFFNALSRGWCPGKAGSMVGAVVTGASVAVGTVVTGTVVTGIWSPGVHEANTPGFDRFQGNQIFVALLSQTPAPSVSHLLARKGLEAAIRPPLPVLLSSPSGF
ncbi:UNVERIFIED_CONTAM: hypothetical protein K2H54_006277 [Gekko kuhli]